jgi:cytochrome c553
MSRIGGWVVLAVCGAAVLPSDVGAGEPLSAAERGWRFVRGEPLLPTDFDQETFDSLWTAWPEPLRTEAEAATPAERRRMAFSRYGLVESPDDLGPALGYVDDGNGGWVMNCLACHGGKVAGKVVPGLPNSRFALQTLTEDVRLTKLRLGRPWGNLDFASLQFSLGGTNGTTDAVSFGVLLVNLRDEQMKVYPDRPAAKVVHHDMDAPPLWNVKKKSRLYADAHAPKYHRVLMQFMLHPQNDAEAVRSRDDDFRDVFAWVESLRPPKWPWPVDRELAARGEAVFAANCAECHGTYGPDESYPQRVVPLDEVGTDPVRLGAISEEFLRQMRRSWLTDHGRGEDVTEPAGYVAPPLDGVWASAPYFHNGSVPTLWHVLHPDERPKVWRRTEDGYDRERVGLETTVFDAVPETVRAPAERRTYFDTTAFGKSAAGHDFPAKLNEAERQALLEYLKTL